MLVNAIFIDLFKTIRGAVEWVPDEFGLTIVLGRTWVSPRVGG